MKDMKRSVRRSHYARLKNKWFKRFKNEWHWANPPGEETLYKWACIRTTAQANCSCTMCGNPRRHFNELTLKEKSANIAFSESLSLL